MERILSALMERTQVFPRVIVPNSCRIIGKYMFSFGFNWKADVFAGRRQNLNRPGTADHRAIAAPNAAPNRFRQRA